MKTFLHIPILALVLLAASSQSFAIQENEDVSKERAKELGVTLRTDLNGQSGVRVWLEFKTQGALKNFTHVDLEMNAEGKRVVAAPLLTTRPTADSVSVHFSADPAWLATSVLTIVVEDGGLGRAGYQFRVKDFIGQNPAGTSGETLEADEQARAAALGFLADLPELKGVSLEMSEQAFRKLMDQRKLRYERDAAKGQVSYYVRIPGKERDANVYFGFRDGLCSGIQRLQPGPKK